MLDIPICFCSLFPLKKPLPKPASNANPLILKDPGDNFKKASSEHFSPDIAPNTHTPNKYYTYNLLP